MLYFITYLSSIYDEPYILQASTLSAVFRNGKTAERLCMPLLVDELGLYLSASVSLCFCVFAGSGET